MIKSMAILFVSVLSYSLAQADFAYYPLTCVYPPATFTAVASFKNVPVQVGAQTQSVPTVQGMFVSFINISCTWDTGGQNDAPIGALVPKTISANVNQWTMQETVIYGNGSTLSGETTYSPVGWSIPLKKKFRVMVTPDPAWQGHIKDGTFPTILQ